MANSISLILLNKLHTNNYTKGFQSNVIRMSNNDSIDEDTKRILSEVDSDDSKESIQKDDKVKEVIKRKEGFNEYEINDEQNLDDSEW